MSQNISPPAPEASAPKGRSRVPGSRKEDWIANQLRRVYDDALQEDIPQRMIDLLNALDRSGSDDGNDR
jgi:Anti-sigma factor NepR